MFSDPGKPRLCALTSDFVPKKLTSVSPSRWLKARTLLPWGNGRVRDHDVERVQREIREQLLVGVLVAHEAHGLGQGEGGLEQPANHELGHHVHDAHVEPERLPARSPLDAVDHLAAQGEDLFRVAEHHTAGLRQRQLAADLGEELLAELIFQRMDLRAQRRVGKPQDLACGDQPSFASDDPEIEQMMIVNPLHD